MSISEVAEGVWQLKVPLRFSPLGYTYSYLIKEDVTIIDAGERSDRAWRAFERQLTTAGLETRDIKRVILTHLHRDHVGLVDYIKNSSAPEIIAHEKAARLKDPGFNDVRKEMKALGGGEFLNLLNRFEYAFRNRGRHHIYRTLVDNELIKLNDVNLRIIWTPGHAPEHICMFDEKRNILFSGDHLLPSITPNVSLHTYEEGDPLADYLRSLDKLVDLSVNMILPAHEHVFNDLKGRIEELRLHHEKRLDEVKEALKGDEKTVYQVASKIYWRSKPWLLMPFWVKRMAAAETLAHLVYINNKGEVEYRVDDGIRYYRLI